MARARDLVDVSLELGHVYPSEVARSGRAWKDGGREAAEEVLDRIVAREAPWARAVLAALEDARRTCHVAVMVDDYSPSLEAETTISVSRLLVEKLRSARVPVEHVVLESECTRGVERMLQQLVRVPAPASDLGTGSRPVDDNLDGERWLVNEDVGPSSSAADDAEVDAFDVFARPADRPAAAPPPAEAPERSDAAPGGHAIQLHVELWSDDPTAGRRWACPTLAACWQLARLGAARTVQDEALRIGTPADELQGLLEDHGGEPIPRARETLTILEPRLQKVEHAVRAILQRVVLPPEWCSHLQEGPQAHLERIGYVFPTTTALRR